MFQWSTKACKILDEGTFDLRSVLSVKSMLDESLFLIQSVKDEVCIGLMRSCEDHNLIQLCHISEETRTEWSHFVYHSAMLEMH